jgi:hypothetical protein
MYISKQNIAALKALTILVLILFAFACKKDDEEETPVTPPLTLDTVFYNSFSGGSAQGMDPLTGDWQVKSGVYHVEHNDSIFNTSSAIDTLLTDYIFEVKARKISGDFYNVGIYFNGDPSQLTGFGNWSNTYKLIIGTHQRWRFGKLVSGNYTQFAFDSNLVVLNPGFGVWNVIRVVVSGGKFEVFLNGNSMGVFTDNTFASGKVGITMFDEFYEGEAEYDYVMIAEIPEGYQWGEPAKKISVPLPEEKFEGDL